MDRVKTALVVVDTCYAGDIATYMSSLDTDLPDGWVVIAAASAHKQAHLGVLTEAVRAFADTGADQDAQPYLDYRDLIPALAEALEEQNWQPFGTPPPRSRSRLLTLPNRHYRPDVDERVPVASARQDVAMYVSDLVAHWDPRSRGVGDASTPGMLFTGRDRLMRTLISAAQGEPGSLVVTGVAGCGKSAVLSRLVTFSDPGFRARYADAVDAADAAGEPLPRVGDVDVAVLAKGSVAQGVLDAIRDRLGIPSIDGETIGDTITRIHQARDGHRRITLVVDALDEAEDPRGIVTSVLAPLVNPPGAAWLQAADRRPRKRTNDRRPPSGRGCAGRSNSPGAVRYGGRRGRAAVLDRGGSRRVRVPAAAHPSRRRAAHPLRHGRRRPGPRTCRRGGRDRRHLLRAGPADQRSTTSPVPTAGPHRPSLAGPQPRRPGARSSPPNWNRITPTRTAAGWPGACSPPRPWPAAAARPAARSGPPSPRPSTRPAAPTPTPTSPPCSTSTSAATSSATPPKTPPCTDPSTTPSPKL